MAPAAAGEPLLLDSADAVARALGAVEEAPGETRRVGLADWLATSEEADEESYQLASRLSLPLAMLERIHVPVDVRALNDASLAFRYHALSGRPLLVRDEAFLDDLRERTWDAYFDFKPFARRYLLEVLDA